VSVFSFFVALIDLSLIIELGFLMRVAGVDLHICLKLRINFHNIFARSLFHDQLMASYMNQVIIIHPFSLRVAGIGNSLVLVGRL